MEFDYFYGPEDAEQYQFYRIPKLLITSERFKDVSVESKLLYGLMLDRLSLSIKNGWFDSLNRAYIIYTVEDVMEDMHCGNQKAIKLIAELEKKAGPWKAVFDLCFEVFHSLSTEGFRITFQEM